MSNLEQEGPRESWRRRWSRVIYTVGAHKDGSEERGREEEQKQLEQEEK